MSNPPSNLNLSRRKFMRGLSSLALTSLASGALAGCGSSTVGLNDPSGSLSAFGGNNGSGNGPNPNLPDGLAGGGSGGGVAFQGTVNRAEVGGTVLSVSSIQAFNSLVNSDGSFEAFASDTNPQLLFLTDTGDEAIRARDEGGVFAGILRGLAIKLPGATVEIGAESTAIAMLFLTFPILTVDPVEAVQRFATLRDLPSFGAFRGFLAANMPSTSLLTLVSNSQLKNLRSACATEFLAAQAEAGPRTKLNLDNFFNEGGMDFKLLDGDPPLAPGLKFQNSGSRFVSVVRQEVDGQGNDVVPPVRAELTDVVRFYPQSTNTMSGLNMASWGSLFFQSVFTPGEANHRFTPNSKTKEVIFWIEGPGRGEGETLPASIPVAMFEDFHYSASIISYWMMPLVDLLSGGVLGLALVKALQNADRAADFALATGPLTTALSGLGFLNGTVDLAANIRSGSVGNIAPAAFNYISIIAGLFAEPVADGIARLVPAGVDSNLDGFKGAAALLGKALTVGGVLFALVNLEIAVDHYLKLPNVHRIIFPLSNLSYLDHVSKDFRHVDTTGEVVYEHEPVLPNSPNAVEYSLRRPPSSENLDPGETALLVSPEVLLHAANNNRQVVGRQIESTSSRHSILLYTLLDSGSSPGELLHTVAYNSDPPETINSPGQDIDFSPKLINDTGDVVGTYQQFSHWAVNSFSSLSAFYTVQVFWVPSGGAFTPVNINEDIATFISTRHPAALNRSSKVILKTMAFNDAGVLLIAYVREHSRTSENQPTQVGYERGLLVYDLVRGSILKELDYQIQTGNIGIDASFILDGFRHAFINNRGDVTYTRSQDLIGVGSVTFHRPGSNGQPTNAFITRSNFTALGLDKDGRSGGFEILSDPTTGRVQTKAPIWRTDGSIDDVHATLLNLDSSLQASENTQVTGLGDGGHILGRVITKQLLFPDLPQGPENPEQEVVKDFLMSPAK